MGRMVMVFGLVVLVSCGFSPGSAEEVAGRIDCDGFESVSAPRLATEAGACNSFFDQRVTIVYFADNDARDQWFKSASEEGGKYLVGDRFVIEGSERTLREMRNVVEGEVRP